jgi:glutaminyl-tRNA synthetase
MTSTEPSRNFLRDIIDADLESGLHDRVVTRFPPEPNGYLHIGHAKAICIDFGLARDYGGVCNLRMDDTNPLKEDTEYVRSIQEDIRWLGFDWEDRFFHAADYFEQLYAYAVELIRKGLAYVCSHTEDEVRAFRGTVTEAGRPSPDRDRPAEESIDLLARMRAGEFEDGRYTLRAKIDMAASNMKLRDPPLYRIRHATHHRTGDDWCIYPMYDFAHGLSDSIEGVTHSICTLEFENNRALYDWFLDHCDVPSPRPHQYEFARLSLTYTVMSKRKLRRMVEEGLVSGWDDPRMPTLSGLRRRGYPAAAIRAFADRVGVAKANSVVDVALLEHTVRDELNRTCPRAMAVLDPLEVVITNHVEADEAFDLDRHPSDPSMGSRSVAFGERLFIERSDFARVPPKGFKRLAPGREVRLKGAYFITCDEVVEDADGEVLRLLCSYDPASKGGATADGRKVSATLHWVAEAGSVEAEVRVYDRLFAVEEPEAGDGDFIEALNPDSLSVTRGARVEADLADAKPGATWQFERQGYFCADLDSRPGALVFNRVVPLRDTWGKSKSKSKSKGRTAAKPTRTKEASAPSPARGPSADELAVLAPWTDLGVSVEAATVLAGDDALAALVEAARGAGADPKAAANLVANDLVRELSGAEASSLPFGGGELASVLGLLGAGAISGKGARKVLAALIEGGGDPAAIVRRLGLEQVSDSAALEPEIDAVLAACADEVARYRGGETRLLGFLLGQVMKRTRGKADPKQVRELLTARLG